MKVKQCKSLQGLDHVGALEFVAQPTIVVARPHARYDGHLHGTVFFTRDPLCFLHQQRTETLKREIEGCFLV